MYLFSEHPKINLFITQGGLQSSDEAIAAAVPVIGVPLLGDQYFNAEQFEVHNIGIKLNMESLTEEHLKNAINATIKDPMYVFLFTIILGSRTQKDPIIKTPPSTRLSVYPSITRLYFMNRKIV